MERKIDVLIVDQEPVCRKTLRTYLVNEDPSLNVVGEAANGAEAYKAISALNPDVVFLDINLQGESGFDLLDRLPQGKFITVLHSADKRHAAAGYKRDVCYFLEKPMALDDLNRCIAKLKQHVEQRMHHTIPDIRRKIELYANGRTHFVPLNDIVYLEASGAYTVIYRENSQRLVVSRNLKSLMDELGDRMFCRIHNSCAVNLTKVESCSYIAKSCVLSSGHELRMAVRRSDELRQRLDRLWNSYHLSFTENRSSHNHLIH